MIKCKNCGIDTLNKTFCSVKCSCQHNSKINNAKRKKIKPIIQCTTCNKDTTNPKFCSQSCAAIYNNKGKNRTRLKEYYCKKCGLLLAIGWNNCQNRTLCQACRNIKKYLPHTKQQKDWSKVTLGEQKSTRTIYKAHAHIRSLSRQIYKKSNKPQHCVKCNWNLHYEICHIKPIASFDDTATIAEINHINNLVALCPNCHWGFDHGHIKL